jgi:hypothetical protein
VFLLVSQLPLDYSKDHFNLKVFSTAQGF